jgi:PAS domain S-box-containing protein
LTSSIENFADPAAQHSEALQILLKSTAMLLGKSSEDSALSGILEVAGKILTADAYAVWREAEDHHTWRVLASRGLSPSYRTEIQARPEDVPATVQVYEDLQHGTALTQFLETYRAEHLRSMIVVPLSLRSGQCGTLTFYWRRSMSFSALDKDYAVALGNLCSTALNTIDLHQQTDREKRRLSFLAEASTILASTLDYETTLNRVAHLVVPQIADWCSIHILESGVVNLLVVAHADPKMQKLADDYTRRYPEQIHPDSGIGLVLRTGQSELIPVVTDDMLVHGIKDPEHLALVRSLRITSILHVPLISRGKVLGAIRLLDAGAARHFTPEDVPLAEDLARRAATAIENAQLHRDVLKKEAELRLAHTAGRMGSWFLDLEGDEMTVSPEFKAVYGIPPDADFNLALGLKMIHPEDFDRVTRELNATFASSSEVVSADHRVIAPDGQLIWVHSRGSIDRDGSGKAKSATGITIDVTDFRQAEKALRRTEKLAAAGRLAATVAHEVNNPLEALTNLIYLAAHTENIPTQAAAYLKTADEELSRIAHIVRQTLGFYRESVHPRQTDLSQLLKEVLDLYRSRAASRHIQLTHAAPTGLTVLAIAGEIKQVLANLISNAIDASPAGSSIDTDVKAAGEFVEITVTDHGTGIDSSHLGRLFEPFFTTKAEVGTGLGLWVSKGIIDKHHGKLTVSSDTTPGRSGATFSIQLPLNGQPLQTV